MLILYNILGPWRAYFWHLPSLLGFLGPRHYIILLQNNNELRPTGGFITAAAQLNILFGIPSMTVFDSYQVPDPVPRVPAPEPFEYFIGKRDPFFAGLTFRDANFSPDFPTSVKEILKLYQPHSSSTIQGVVAIDFTVLETLLKLYGPLNIDKNTPVNKDNFFQISQRMSKDIDTHNESALASRKSALIPIFEELKSRIVRSPGSYGTLLKSSYDLARKKHLLQWFSSPTLQQIAGTLSTDGSFACPSEKDFLHVNITNIGGRKADRYIPKNISYRLRSLDDGLRAHLEVQFEHFGSYNIQSDIYQAYIRAYVPLGSKLLGSSSTRLRSTTSGQEFGCTFFADYLRIAPDEEITLSYDYLLPESIAFNPYVLQLRSQPGDTDSYYHLGIRAPNDMSLSNGDQSETTLFEINENVAFWQGVLDEDKLFQLRTLDDTSPPVILWQEFVDLKTVNVRFHEELDAASVSDLTHFSITDLNKQIPDVTDSIRIINARFEGRDLYLTLQGLTSQPNESYSLELRNLQDQSGNRIDPSPLTRTLVQRLP